MAPRQLRHNPHHCPAALAIASAGDMLPADDSVDKDWRWGIEGQRDNQVLLASSKEDQPGRSEHLPEDLRTITVAPRKQDPLTYPVTPTLTAECGQKPGSWVWESSAAEI